MQLLFISIMSLFKITLGILISHSSMFIWFRFLSTRAAGVKEILESLHSWSNRPHFHGEIARVVPNYPFSKILLYFGVVVLTWVEMVFFYYTKLCIRKCYLKAPLTYFTPHSAIKIINICFQKINILTWNPCCKVRKIKVHWFVLYQK